MLIFKKKFNISVFQAINTLYKFFLELKIYRIVLADYINLFDRSVYQALGFGRGKINCGTFSNNLFKLKIESIQIKEKKLPWFSWIFFKNNWIKKCFVDHT